MRPSVINGSSAGWPPRSVKIKKAAKNCQVIPFRIGSLAHLTDQRPLLKQGTTTTSTAATRPIILILTIMLGVMKRCFQSTPPAKTKLHTAPRPQEPPAAVIFRPSILAGRTAGGGESREGPEVVRLPQNPTPKPHRLLISRPSTPLGA